MGFFNIRNKKRRYPQFLAVSISAELRLYTIILKIKYTNGNRVQLTITNCIFFSRIFSAVLLYAKGSFPLFCVVGNIGEAYVEVNVALDAVHCAVVAELPHRKLIVEFGRVGVFAVPDVIVGKLAEVVLEI